MQHIIIPTLGRMDKQLTYNALNNDELGKYTGRADIAQARLFMSGGYDRNYLLMIDDKVLQDGTQFNGNVCDPSE